MRGVLELKRLGYVIVVLLITASVCNPKPRQSNPQDDTASPGLRMNFDEFKKLFDTNKVLILDVNSLEEYTAGHIPGAVSMPLDALDQHIDELKKQSKAIVTYCR